MRFTKWGGKKHWTYEMEQIGTDVHGTWFGAREGIRLQRGHEDPIRQTHDFVQLIPADGWYVAAFNADGNPKLSLYVDITDQPVITGDVVTAVDLDLDVVRTWAGRVELLDEDEFEEHQVRYGYPPEVVAGARASADRLMAAVAAGEEPFGAVGVGWLERYGR